MKISSAFSGVPLWQFSSHETVFFSKSLRQLGACEFHTEMGKLILEHGETLERFTGDGMMPRSVRSVLKNGSTMARWALSPILRHVSAAKQVRAIGRGRAYWRGILERLCQ